MKKIKCIIADDEPLAVRLLETYVGRIDSLELVASCHSGREALEVLRRGGVDLAFLDIQMPDLNGMELARDLADTPTRVVFVTAYRDYAVEGFRVNALDYLLKPVSMAEFREAVSRAEREMLVDDEPTFITVRSDYRNVRVELCEILYVEGLKDYVKLYLTSRERPLITQMTLKAVEQTLPAKDFLRVHRSYIVGLRHIVSYSQSRLKVGSTEVPVGDTYKNRLQELSGL